jgi:hypothetical protein
MELADNTYLDGDRKSALKVLEEVDPHTTEPRTIWKIPFLPVLLKLKPPLFWEEQKTCEKITVY